MTDQGTKKPPQATWRENFESASKVASAASGVTRAARGVPGAPSHEGVPAPHRFMGGSGADYEVATGPSGTWGTRHLPSGKVIQSVRPGNPGAPGGGMDLIGLANVGLNLINLGVGVYNAYQLHKVRDGLEQVSGEVRAGVSSLRQQIDDHLNGVHRGLEAQARMLEILCSSQQGIEDRLDLVRQEMAQGFREMVAVIDDQAAQRRQEEFFERVRALEREYRAFSLFLQNPEAKKELAVAAEGVERSASSLLSWAESQLSRVERGSPARLPLNVACVFATRARGDALHVRGGHWRSVADQEMADLEHRISQEAFQLVDESTLWSIGVSYVDIIAQYAMLLRGIRRGRDIEALGEGRLLPVPEDAYWDDGLESLRMAVVEEREAEKAEVLRGTDAIPLRTIKDYQWFVRFRGLDAETYDVHQNTEVGANQVFASLGHPSPGEGVLLAGGLDAVRQIAIPGYREKVVERLVREFGWAKRPAIAESKDARVPTNSPPQIASTSPTAKREEPIRDVGSERYKVEYGKFGDQRVVYLDLSAMTAEVEIAGRRFRYTVASGNLLHGELHCDLRLKQSSGSAALPIRIQVEVPRRGGEEGYVLVWSDKHRHAQRISARIID